MTRKPLSEQLKELQHKHAVLTFLLGEIAGAWAGLQPRPEGTAAQTIDLRIQAAMDYLQGAGVDPMQEELARCQVNAERGRLVLLLGTETRRMGQCSASLNWSPAGWWVEFGAQTPSDEPTPEAAIRRALGSRADIKAAPEEE